MNRQQYGKRGVLQRCGLAMVRALAGFFQRDVTAGSDSDGYYVPTAPRGWQSARIDVARLGVCAARASRPAQQARPIRTAPGWY